MAFSKEIGTYQQTHIHVCTSDSSSRLQVFALTPPLRPCDHILHIAEVTLVLSQKEVLAIARQLLAVFLVVVCCVIPRFLACSVTLCNAQTVVRLRTQSIIQDLDLENKWEDAVCITYGIEGPCLGLSGRHLLIYSGITFCGIIAVIYTGVLVSAMSGAGNEDVSFGMASAYAGILAGSSVITRHYLNLEHKLYQHPRNHVLIYIITSLQKQH